MERILKCSACLVDNLEFISRGYVALVPELKGCHTQAKSLDMLMKRVRVAIELCLEVEGDQSAMPEFVDVHRIAV